MGTDAGGDDVLRWVSGVAFGALLAGFSLAALASMTGRRRMSPAGVVLGVALAIAVAALAVVIARIDRGTAGGWDWLWAVVSAVVALAAGRSLFGPRRA